MHHALEIHEILLFIFGFCYELKTRKERSDLANLARTCRAFKEPALDVLWEELDGLSPLAQCLPEASHPLFPISEHLRCFSFTRPLTDDEWDILRSYTRRIRSISIPYARYGLDWESIGTLSVKTEPLFPNLRNLCFEYSHKAMSILLLPLPSLVSLDVTLHDRYLFGDTLKSFAAISQNVGILSIHAYHYIDMSEIEPSFICQWRHLHTVICPGIVLDVNALVHLSHSPTLTRLSFTSSIALPDQIPSSDSPLTFFNLHRLALHSQSLDSVSRLLSQTRMPSITSFTASVESRPSMRDVSSFLANPMTCVCDTLQELQLVQKFALGYTYVPDSGDRKSVLCFENLQPCMALRNLRLINIDIECKVDLTGSELLMLALAWPRLECFLLNMEWGWRTRGGITPDGLVQFLQKCPSLNRIALAVDTRVYTDVPQSLESLRSTLPRLTCIDVVDSHIEEESVPATAAFFASIVPRPEFSFNAWESWEMKLSPNWDVCKIRWGEVHRLLKEAVEQHS